MAPGRKFGWLAKIILAFTFVLAPDGYRTYVDAKKTESPVPKKMKSDGKSTAKNVYEQYRDVFEEVYETMEKNYYYTIERDDFDRFLKKFDRDIYGKLQNKKEKVNYIAWRSAAFLVDYLKDPEDTFSAFIPPKPAKEFESKVLGQKVDLGIEGQLSAEGFVVTRIEPRSDAYMKGLREQDIILKIDNVLVIGLTQEKVTDLLTPLIDTTVRLNYFVVKDKKEMTVDVVSQEYFKQSVFMVPVEVPGVYCLEIRTFNRKTSDDMFRFLSFIKTQGNTSLILDLRGNPGGPPLAAREIASFFLPPGDEFAYFQLRDKPKAVLDVPKLPGEYHYSGPMAILVNDQSGSASELFSGVMQKRGRAVLMGTNTAGKVVLKSMFHFDDESMLLLITGRGFFPDGSVFSFQGLNPDFPMQKQGDDLMNFAAGYLSSLKNSKSGKP